VTIELATNSVEVHRSNTEPWRVTLVDTGEATMTGGRLARVMDRVAGDDEFCFTYGDGVADVDLTALLAFHRSGGRLATMTAVQPPGRFGALELDGDVARRFTEKPQGEGGWINGGFFVLDPGVARYLGGDDTVWEQQPLERLAAEGQLGAYLHRGFFQPMDTLRDRMHLEQLWQSGQAPWLR
jgi:glucose-1-phosphate cytidylyltransferase